MCQGCWLESSVWPNDVPEKLHDTIIWGWKKRPVVIKQAGTGSDISVGQGETQRHGEERRAERKGDEERKEDDEGGRRGGKRKEEKKGKVKREKQ